MNALHDHLSLSKTPPSTYTFPNTTHHHHHHIDEKQTKNTLPGQEKNLLSHASTNDHNVEHVQKKEREERPLRLSSMDDCLFLQPACICFEKKAQGSKTTDISLSNETVEDGNEAPSVTMNTKNEEVINVTPDAFFTQAMKPTQTQTFSPSTPMILADYAHAPPSLIPLLPRRRVRGGAQQHCGKRVRLLESFDPSLLSLPYLPSESVDDVSLPSIKEKMKTIMSSSLKKRKVTKEDFPIPSGIRLLPRSRTIFKIKEF
jgi:hypothetical protein